MTERIDGLDRRLATALMARPTATFTDLAGELGVAATTLSHRYRRLRDAELIHVTVRSGSGAAATDRLVRLRGEPGSVDEAAARVETTAPVRWSRRTVDGSEAVLLLAGIDAVMPWSAAVRVDTAQLLHLWSAAAIDRGATGRADPDAVDRRLIAALAADARADLATLAVAAGVDPSTVSRRRRRLIDSGLVEPETVVDPRVWGGPGEVLLWLDVAPGRIEPVGRALYEHSAVDFVAAISGPAVLVARVRTGPGIAPGEFVDRVCGRLAVTGAQIVPVIA